MNEIEYKQIQEDVMRLAGQADAEIATMKVEINELRSHLREAAEIIEDWGCYVSDYFKEKHKLEKDIKRFKALGDVCKGKR